MKLLHDVVQLCANRVGGMTARDPAVHTFRVTVPAPLVKPPVGDQVSLVAPLALVSNVVPARREPASFLKAPRHLRRRLSH